MLGGIPSHAFVMLGGQEARRPTAWRVSTKELSAHNLWALNSVVETAPNTNPEARKLRRSLLLLDKVLPTMSEAAEKVAKKLRAKLMLRVDFFVYPSGTTQPWSFEDAGVEDWDNLDFDVQVNEIQHWFGNRYYYLDGPDRQPPKTPTLDDYTTHKASTNQEFVRLLAKEIAERAKDVVPATDGDGSEEEPRICYIVTIVVCLCLVAVFVLCLVCCWNYDEGDEGSGSDHHA